MSPRRGSDVINMEGQRAEGRVIDIERLQRSEPELFIHRFVQAVRSARQELGPYLYLRTGDEVAISAAQDGSRELLEQVTVVGELLG